VIERAEAAYICYEEFQTSGFIKSVLVTHEN